MSTSDPITALRTGISSAAGELGDGAGARLQRPRGPTSRLLHQRRDAVAPAPGEQPRTIAERLGAALTDTLATDLERVEVAGPGSSTSS
jgi:hypothetical protein